MSGPVITGLPPDTLAQILELLKQFGITVVDLAQMGITTYEGAGGLKEFMLNNGWELKEVWDLKQMWFYTGAGNATESNALVQYVANELTVGGAAGAQYVANYSYGESTMGKLKKGVIFGSILALLISSLDPTLITDALKGRLNSTLDTFADENDEIPVIVNKDGKTYYHEDMINALRQVLIDEGVYVNGNVFPSYSTSGSVTITSAPNAKNLLDYALSKLTNCTYSIPDATKQSMYDFIDAHAGEAIAISVYDTPGAYEGWSPLTITAYRNATVDTTFTINRTTFTVDIFSCYGRKTAGQNVMSIVNYKTDINAGYRIEYIGETRDNNYILVSNVNVTSSSGVDGITVASDLINKGIGNIATSLDDIFDNYATDYVTTIDPSDEDLEGKDKWYPVSSNNNDVWVDGINETDSETAPDGDIDTDLDDFIADAIKKIIDDYYRDPLDPGTIDYPEIPVGDNGDTPPAEPPLISGSANGLWAIYNPTLAQVQNFGAYLWSENILDQITRMFNSPIDAVIGFHMIYCTPIKGPTQNIKCGYLDTGVASVTVANQYATIDCGTVFVSEYYRTALDYNATKLALYLPFIGIVPLSTEVCVGSTLHVIYRIDVLTGTCLAQVKVIKQNSDAVMYAFEGNCAVQIPLTATTYTGTVTALINSVSAGLSAFMGDYISAGQDLSEAVSGAMSKTGVKQSGSLGANAGALGIRIPYLIITHPVAYDAIQYNTQYGFPLNETVTLGSLHGYTRVKDIHLSAIPCTDDELEQIERLLKDGVIIS